MAAQRRADTAKRRADRAHAEWQVAQNEADHLQAQAAKAFDEMMAAARARPATDLTQHTGG